jgi:hypothetical protein
MIYEVSAAPIICERGEILPQGKNEIAFMLHILNAAGRYNSDGAYSEFSSGEKLLKTSLNMSFGYGSSSGSEIKVAVPYISKSYTDTVGLNYAASGFGDISIIGKNQIVSYKQKESYVSFLLGGTIPTSRSIYKSEKGILPLGEGYWNVKGGLSLEEKRDKIMLYGDVFYVYRFGLTADSFAGSQISAVKAGENSVNIKPGASLVYDVAVEYPFTKGFSFTVELNGRIDYESKAEYSTSGADAVSDLNLLDPAEYILSKKSSLTVMPSIGFSLMNTISLKAGAGIPVTCVNGFGNINYFFYASLML